MRGFKWKTTFFDIEKAKGSGERWQYTWNANGSLREVLRPDRKKVTFEYDALGRRTAKVFNKQITRWLWDGNTPLHEWNYKLEDRPKTIKDEFGFELKDKPEPIENLVTWIFEEGSFKPTAKIVDEKPYSIITDYLGTPIQAYDERGILTWERELNIYGATREEKGISNFVPFMYQGQYHDTETGLYYNRFRYYSPNEGMYLSQDPIGLEGANPTLYGYVKDINTWVDEFGLHCSKALANNLIKNGTKRPANTIAHHIVGSSKRAKPAKDILTKHKIHIDSHKMEYFYQMGQKVKLQATCIQKGILMII